MYGRVMALERHAEQRREELYRAYGMGVLTDLQFIGSSFFSSGDDSLHYLPAMHARDMLSPPGCSFAHCQKGYRFGASLLSLSG